MRANATKTCTKATISDRHILNSYIADMTSELATLAGSAGEAGLGRLLNFAAIEATVAAKRDHKES